MHIFTPFRKSWHLSVSVEMFQKPQPTFSYNVSFMFNAEPDYIEHYQTFYTSTFHSCHVTHKPTLSYTAHNSAPASGAGSPGRFSCFLWNQSDFIFNSFSRQGGAVSRRGLAVCAAGFGGWVMPPWRRSETVYLMILLVSKYILIDWLIEGRLHICISHCSKDEYTWAKQSRHV